MGYLHFFVNFYLKNHARVVKFSYLNFAPLNLYPNTIFLPQCDNQVYLLFLKFTPIYFNFQYYSLFQYLTLNANNNKIYPKNATTQITQTLLVMLLTFILSYREIFVLLCHFSYFVHCALIHVKTITNKVYSF